MAKKKRKVWQWIKEAFHDPILFLTFAIVWCLLESPAIFGLIAFWLTGNEAWFALFSSWVALTALPLPIPVAPISIAVAIAVHEFFRKRRKKRANGSKNTDKTPSDDNQTSADEITNTQE